MLLLFNGAIILLQLLIIQILYLQEEMHPKMISVLIWTSEQHNTFYYLYATDRVKAAEYATQINNGLDAAKRQEQAEDLQENRDDLLGWAEARVMNIGGIAENNAADIFAPKRVRYRLI